MRWLLLELSMKQRSTLNCSTMGIAGTRTERTAGLYVQMCLYHLLSYSLFFFLDDWLFLSCPLNYTKQKVCILMGPKLETHQTDDRLYGV